MTPRRTRYSLWLDPEHLDGLKRLKERDGIPESEAIRRALDVFLRRKGIKRGRKARNAERDVRGKNRRGTRASSPITRSPR
jgi:hypothetical protein